MNRLQLYSFLRIKLSHFEKGKLDNNYYYTDLPKHMQESIKSLIKPIIKDLIIDELYKTNDDIFIKLQTTKEFFIENYRNDFEFNKTITSWIKIIENKTIKEYLNGWNFNNILNNYLECNEVPQWFYDISGLSDDNSIVEHFKKGYDQDLILNMPKSIQNKLGLQAKAKKWNFI